MVECVQPSHSQVLESNADTQFLAQETLHAYLTVISYKYIYVEGVMEKARLNRLHM